MKIIIQRFITKEDFLGIESLAEGGTIIDGKKYAAMSENGEMSSENQIKILGKPDRTGEGVMDKVFFFEILEGSRERGYHLKLVSAKIVDHYESIQEVRKELALIRAKITLKDKENFER